MRDGDITTFYKMIAEINSIYQTWLNIFPFELDIFAHLKTQFEEELPIVKNNKAFWNKQNNEIVIDLYSTETFQQFLTEKTTSILDQFNTLKLVEDGKIDQIDKHDFDITISERRFKLKSQVIKSRNESLNYLNFIQEWYKDETTFIEKIKNKYSSIKPTANNTDFSVLDWAVIFYYQQAANQFEKSKNKIDAMKLFMEENNLSSSFKGFSNKYYSINMSINEKSNHPYKQIEKILPFLKKNKKAYQLAENDIEYLKNEAK